MCSQTTCRQCGKPTWAGCGAHIEQALANVPVTQRCQCREKKALAPAASTSAASTRGYGPG